MLGIHIGIENSIENLQVLVTHPQQLATFLPKNVLSVRCHPTFFFLEYFQDTMSFKFLPCYFHKLSPQLRHS